MAIVILINVDVDPIIDDARPAIWPTGSIAIARKLPNRNPKQKNWSEKNNRITLIGGFTELKNKTV